jgi:hypothetical protein
MGLHLHRGVIAAVALVVGLVLTALPARADDPLTVDDLVRLLEASVGEQVVRKKVQLTGSRFDLDVDAILRLRAAGASSSLLEFLLDTAAGGAEQTATQAGPAGTTGPDDEARVFRARTSDGREAIVLTNLGGERGPPEADRLPRPSVISSSERFETGAGPEITLGPEAGIPGPFPSLLPPVAGPARREDEVLEERVSDMEAWLADLEEWVVDLETEPEEPPVDREPGWESLDETWSYAFVDWPWGGAVWAPVVSEPQEYLLMKVGPFLSFTGAAHAGFDPFEPPRPCQPGIACSVHERVLTSGGTFSPGSSPPGPRSPQPSAPPRRRRGGRSQR